MNDTVIGDYIQGIELDTSSYVKVAVNVITPGSYTISTNTVNGYSFSDTGTFAVAGPQTIRLSSKGAPLNSGTNKFIITAGAFSCGFSVTVLPVAITANNDLFPLTANSYWVYDDALSPGTNVKTTVIDSTTINGELYKIMNEQALPALSQSFRYRKSGSDYFEYGQIDKYTASVRYNKLIYDDLPFLKESVFAGDTWRSKEYSDTASFGQVINIQYVYLCLAADIHAVINGKAFTHVYKIQMKPQIRSLDHGFNNTGEIYTYYYVRGIGLVSYQETNMGSNYGELKINNWKVN